MPKVLYYVHEKDIFSINKKFIFSDIRVATKIRKYLLKQF